MLLGDIAAFDCRISELPNIDLVLDYFRWRSEDAHRNALNAHCYWKLRNEKFSKNEATNKVKGLSISEKNELLFQYGLNVNDLPNWQKRGIGFYWKEVKTDGFNPKLNIVVEKIRRELFVDFELPMKDSYSDYLKEKILAKK